MPLDAGLQERLGNGQRLRWLRPLYAPLTEEPAKLWPLLLPGVRRKVTRERGAPFALALGPGFALGEIFTVASFFATRQPEIAALPWDLLGGFIAERFMTCMIHSGMTAIALASWRRGPGIVVGLVLAMLAHFFANFPIVMAQRGWLGPYPEVAQTLVALWVVGCAVAGLAWLQSLHFKKGQTGLGHLIYEFSAFAEYGKVVCLGCSHEYERSLWWVWYESPF